METFLYIKEHSISGMRYFGKTTKDPYVYKGSGKYWINHIKKYGIENIRTLWVSKFDNIEDLKEFAIFFSEFFDVVGSSNWANLIVENGLDGAPKGVLNKGPTGSKNGMFGKVKELNPFYGKTHPIELKDKWSKNRIGELNPNYKGKAFTEKTIDKLRRPKQNKDNYKGSPNQINCIDKLGNGVRISCELYNSQKSLNIPMNEWEYVNCNSKAAKLRKK